MQIKIYHILIFISIIVTATVLVFPDQHFVARELINSGRLDTARYYIKRYTNKNPNDAILFIMSSDTYLIEGMPDKAIEELKPFLDHEGVSKKLLFRLAQLYEWERNPRMALKVLERTAEVFPNDKNVWNRLISYYRYLGQSENEVNAIISIVKLNNQNAEKDIILSIIDKKQFEIAKEHSKNPDPMTAYLLSKFHVIRNNYADDIADPHITKQKKNETAEFSMMRIIELYVYADLMNEIKIFAHNLDQKLNTGYKYRFALTNVLRWSDLDDDALSYLWQLQKNNPDQPEILDQIVKISLENDRIDEAITALKNLWNSKPGNPDYGKQLARLYDETEKYSDAFDIYKALQKQSKGKGYAVKLLNTAMNSNQKKLMLEAINTVKDIRAKPSELLKQIVESYLFIEKPRRAFEYGLQYIKTQLTPAKEYVEKLFDIAVWANSFDMIKQSISLVKKYFSDDPALIIKSGDAFLSLEKPKEAFLIYGTIIHSKTNDREFLLKYMDIASYTENPEFMISAALTTSKLRPKDLKIINKCVQLLQWSNHIEKAYAIFEKWFRQNGGNSKQAQQLLRLAQETALPKTMKRAVQLTKQSMPHNPEIQLEIAEQAIASGLIDEAIYAFEDYLNSKKDDTAVQRQLAELYVWTGQQEAAFQIYQKLHEKFPDDIPIRDKMIEIAEWTKNSAATAYLVAEMADEKPSDESLQLKAGEAWIAAGETEKSISYFEQALKKNPGNIELLRKLAQYYGWLERYDDSIKTLEKIESYGTLSENEIIQLAQASMDRKNPQKVIALLNEQARDKTLSETSGILLAAAYEQTGQKDKAISIYKTMAQQYPDNSEILTEMGNQLLWMKRLDVALTFYKQAISIDPENMTALKGCAQIYAWHNNSDKAIQYYERYIQLNPDDYEVRYQLGELLFSKGQKRYAFKHYQKALALINRAKKNTIQDDR
ncbi:hypothetical protein MHK_000527 [Candidatus Magnetomorum sp. HK-1]|nr:hypothetical protein MHK_000527 [Candidatus Magnetomorum sp. HK-1]